MPLNLPELHYPTIKSPWTPPQLLLQDNIAMHVNGLDILQNPAVN